MHISSEKIERVSIFINLHVVCIYSGGRCGSEDKDNFVSTFK